MSRYTPSKNGSALVIALGFLALLTVMILAFAMRSRTDRLSGRSYLENARANQLLHTALARAMEDIDRTFGSEYPTLPAFGSDDPAGAPVGQSVNFSTEENYLPMGNQLISNGYANALVDTDWIPISTGNDQIGRVAYIVINTSGLLDANHVGGIHTDGSILTRSSGRSPREIQIDPGLIPELNSGASLITESGEKETAPSAQQAFVSNRDKRWKRFETLRDIKTLNDAYRGGAIKNDALSSFSTFSFLLDTNDLGRVYMGTNLTSVLEQEDEIREALDNLPAVDTDFVMNQLIDYLDEDRIPQDIDLSVEAVPLINELKLFCSFIFVPNIEPVETDDGSEIQVTSVDIEASHTVTLETWYPFTGYGADEDYMIAIDDSPLQDGSLPADLFGDLTGGGASSELSAWRGEFGSIAQDNQPDEFPFTFDLYAATNSTSVSSPNELMALFEEMETDIEFPSITCSDGSEIQVDRVVDLLLPMESAVANDLLPEIEILSSNLFTAVTAESITNFNFAISMECIEPRLNSEGSSTNIWIVDIGVGRDENAGSLGEINESAILGNADPVDETGKIFVRNNDRIDSPWEFTYFLYDTSNPWKTIQMLAEYDDEDNRLILDALSPFPDGSRPRYGLINPNTPHTNVIASTFLSIPTDPYNLAPLKRVDATQATELAQLFMEHMNRNGWSSLPSAYTEGYAVSELENMINAANNWETEALFRSTYELFNPNDTSYTIFLVAQTGSEHNTLSGLQDDEIRASQQAIANVWRDPVSGKAAITFFGLTDTLRGSAYIEGESWGSLLNVFAPE